MIGKGKKVLVVEDEEDLRELVTFCVQTEFGADVIEASSGEDAIQKIKAEPGLAAVVCDYRMPKGNGGFVFEYLKNNNLQIPYIMCSSDSLAEHPEINGPPFAGHAQKPMFQEGLRTHLKAIFSDATKSSPAQSSESIAPEENYVRVPPNLLPKMGIMPCDVYLKIGSSKFLKLVHQGDTFESADLEKAYEKKIESLWIEKAQNVAFIDKLVSEMMTLNHAKVIAKKDTGELGVLGKEAQETLHAWVQEMGYSEAVEKLTKAHVNLALQALTHSPDLSKLLGSFKTDPNSYLASHSTLLPYLACFIAELMGWASEQTLHKLTLASFLHDVSLKKDDVARIQSVETARATLKGDDLKAFEQHPLEAAQICKKYKEIPPDVDVVILQHHERPDGSGFPSGCNHTRLSPLSAVFIVAHDMLSYQEKNGNLGLADFLSAKQSEYGFGAFKKISAALAVKAAR